RCVGDDCARRRSGSPRPLRAWGGATARGINATLGPRAPRSRAAPWHPSALTDAYPPFSWHEPLTDMTSNPRVTEHSIDPQFAARWSPRAFTGEAIDTATLLSFFEAARWAPSAFNSQPWRFLYARRDTPQWPRFVSLLSEFNRGWAQHASA